jgi:hypothetical protein
VSESFFEFLTSPFLADLDFYVNDSDLSEIVVSLIHRGSPELRLQIFHYLIQVSDSALMRSPVQRVVRAMIQESSHDQLEQWLLRIAKFLRSSVSCDDIVASLFSVAPFRVNLHFLVQNSDYIERMTSNEFQAALLAVDSSVQLLQLQRDPGSSY